MVQRSEGPIGIDATNFKAALIAESNIVMTPKFPVVGSFSEWTLSISELPLPLQKQCYIKLTFQNDLRFKKESMLGTGLFRHTSNK